MADIIYLTLWEVIGIISGVFFFMLFLIALACYLYQVYSSEIQFDPLDVSESGQRTVYDEGAEKQSSFKRICETMFTNIKEWREHCCSAPDDHDDSSHDHDSTKIKKKRKKKAKPKVKKAIPLTDYTSGSDEEKNLSNVNKISNSDMPSKTQHLYGDTNSRRVDGYSDSDSVSCKFSPPSQHTATGSSVSRDVKPSSYMVEEPNSTFVDTADNDVNEYEISTSFSGRLPRKHPSQQEHSHH